MSSFKRKGTSKSALPTYSGTRICPGSTQTLLTSTGISSLDDILGGGLALSCSLVIATPDAHSSYGDLVLKYFVAQGLISGHRVCMVGGPQEELMRFVRECMWVSSSNDKDDEDEEGNGDDQAQKVKIAWRYEKMKQFKTTVGSNWKPDGESYCPTFDLSTTIPQGVIDDELKTDRLHLIDVSHNPSMNDVLEGMTKYLSSDTSAPVRICIPNLGSPFWGELTAQSILYFLHSLRARLREYGHGCAAIGLPPHLSVKNWGGEGWLEKVGWMSSGLLSLAAFSANPGLSTLFPAHHGLVQIYTLPSPHTYVAPSDRFSVLRGLKSSGENNLAFKCTRKRFLIETLHLDIEGGTGERRTTASKTAVADSSIELTTASVEGKKKKKVVGFQSDRPELCQGYDSDDELLSMPLLPDDPISSHTRSYSKSVVNHDFLGQEHYTKLMDSNHYPDHHSYPYKHHLYNNSQPQAYTPPASAPYPIYQGDEDSIATAITTDSPMPLQGDPRRSQPPQHRSQDPSRWSSSYSPARSRSSSIGNGYQDASPPPLSTKPSYDISWQTVDEKDEIAISEEETDDEQGLENLDDEQDKDDGEPTSAALVAEQGRGFIVHADTVPILQLQIQPDTTHLLIGSSTTPNAVPSFLTSTLPQIAHSLLALDISANFLGALPPVLAVCENLEELNVASNPLRVLPVFLADLINLRVLIADATGISTLPDTLVDLDKLHTISIRRNKLHALPCWLCLLPALQTLCVDGNPFQGPWKALVDPLLAKVPTSPFYPPSTPMMPLSASVQTPQSTETENDGTDVDELSDHDVSSPNGIAVPVQPSEEEDQTVTIERTMLGRAKTTPYLLDQQPPQQPSSKRLVRTRTTPNRAYYDQARAKSSAGLPLDSRPVHQGSTVKPDDASASGSSEIRRMKSAGDLRRTQPVTSHGADGMPLPPIANFPTSLSSSNLLSMGGAASALQNANSPTLVAGGVENAYPKRFASLGPNSQLASSAPPGRRATATTGGRPHLSQSLWEPNGVNENGQLARSSSYNPSAVPRPPKMDAKTDTSQDDETKVQKTRSNQNQKNSRWGFLKKMSMGKIKSDTPPSNSTSPNSQRISRAGSSTGTSPRRQFGSVSRLSKTPQIDVRFSTTGALDAFPALTGQQSDSPSPPSPIVATPSVVTPPAPTTNGLLVPPTATRSIKRRSFLPIDAPGQMSLSIPENSKFVSGVVVSHDGDDQQLNGSLDPARGPHSLLTPVVDSDQTRRREEERARDAYMRALRSVMAYLKDMNDLSHVQQSNSLSMYGSSSDEQPQHPRSRRPTVVERESSSGGSTADTSTHLRSPESIAGMRSGSSSQTLSVATTDSSGSQEERKFKDDKGKRAMVIREIVATERTYVKGLRELVDIYIQPACAPVNLLSGSKDSVVPASERKVVFGGIDSLFSFHNDSFLPALEGAAAPLMKPPAELQELDGDGQLSLNVAKAVGNIFVKHAAFMRMYSSYINNFDSSVQRVKYWTSDKYASGSSSPGNALTPSSSSAHLVGLGISMGISGAAGALSESLPAVTGIPNLSTSQRKRIKTYLKRCRLNPRHTQLNLEGYLLLPVQRIPRYKLLLEELVRSTPPPLYEYLDDPLDRALSEITVLASNMNEGKREAESRRKLVRWQTRIRGKFPSPLVQPHRKLIMDGPLLLTRVVRKAVVSFEAFNAQGDSSTVQVDCLAPELTPRPLVGILCNDLLVLCRDPSEGQDPSSPVDLWAVLRMQTLPQPASIVHGNALRLVDNKAILYFDAPSPSDALNWYRAINLHIPASKA